MEAQTGTGGGGAYRFKIGAVDRQIDETRRQLQSLETIRPLSAASWQRAWDRHPDLYARERALFQRRGELQEARDRIDARQPRRARAAKPKFKTCTTCGFNTLQEAA